MSISELEDRLFDDWAQSRAGFVRDGVVNEEAYLASDFKIAVILKEVNDPDGGGWDLRQFLREGGRPRTWNNVARWLYGIRNLQSPPNWGFFESVTEQFRIEVLESICAMNLKKSPGTHTADNASLDVVVREDRDRIKEQFSLYDPDLVICGGTGDRFHGVTGEDAEWKMTSRGIWWYEREPGKPVISYAHPEARVQDSLLLYGLLDALREIIPA